MRLGAKSRYLLELLAVLGSEAIQGLLELPQFKKSIAGSSEDNFWRRARLLRSNGILDFDDTRTSGKWVAKLSQSGISAIDENINPEREWNTPWDGQWRLFAFDLPKDRNKERQALRYWLKQKRLGKLQGSLWITPKNLSNWMDELTERKVDPTAVILFNGNFEGTNTPQEYVRNAWNFERINQAYSNYLDFLSKIDPTNLSPNRFPECFRKEIELWRAAFNEDPFLPRELWPSPSDSIYLGPQALTARQAFYGQWKQALRIQ